MAGTPKRSRLGGAGRKTLYYRIEKIVDEWIVNQRKVKKRVTRRSIKNFAKTCVDNTSDVERRFDANNGWLSRFMVRYNWTRRRRTSVCQKLPPEYEKKIANYVYFVRKQRKEKAYDLGDIYAADETAVWLNCLPDDTIDHKGSKEVSVKTTGHEKAKITVMLTASPKRKMKPFVLINRIRPIKALEKFKTQLNICYSGKMTSMNDQLTAVYLRNTFPKNRLVAGKPKLLAWDSFRCHNSEATKKVLCELGLDVAMVPGGTTKYIQAPDVSWNRPFKKSLVEQYDDWMSDEANMELTKGGNLKPPTFTTVCTWIANAWKNVTMEIVEKSFKC